MSQKAKARPKNQQDRKRESSLATAISSTGKKVIAGGCLALILGFFVLSRTDSLGRNWASCLSPFLILGAYALIGLGILWP